jgi:DNA polymerase-3 subunit epsilon
MTSRHFWRSARDLRATSGQRAVDEDRAPGWEYLLLAHGVLDAVQTYRDRYEQGLAHSSGKSIASLQDAVRNVSLQADVFRAIIGNLQRLLSSEVLEAAVGKPGEKGNPERIRKLAGDIAEVYGLMLGWQAEVRSTKTPSPATSLYEALACCASTPLEEMRAFAQKLARDTEEVVSQLRAGHPPNRDVVIALTLTIDPAAQTAVEHELEKLMLAADASGESESPVPTQSRAEVARTEERRSVAVASRSPQGPLEALSRGVELGAGGFVAIDFETATRFRASACAVGVALVTAGQVSDVRRWLIQPPRNEYESINISIHGITPKMTADSPEFSEVWPEVLSTIGELPLVAHYAAFDIGVLRASLAAEGQIWPTLTYVCTCVLARHAWPGWLSYRLDDVAHACGVEFQHHEAGADASAAAQLGIALCGATGQPSLLDASRELGVWPGELRGDEWTACGIHSSGVHPKYSELRPTVDDIVEDGQLYGKAVVFTGALNHFARGEAAQRAVNAGAFVMNSMSRKIDYLVCGMQDARVVKDGVHSTKMLKATELNANGAHIELLSEVDFYRMLQS